MKEQMRRRALKSVGDDDAAEPTGDAAGPTDIETAAGAIRLGFVWAELARLARNGRTAAHNAAQRVAAERPELREYVPRAGVVGGRRVDLNAVVDTLVAAH